MGGIFVNPYREATIAELYLKLRQERMGIPRDILSGPADPYFSPNSNFTSNGNWNRQ